MSAIQLFDKNSELRFDGTSVGGGGAQLARNVGQADYTFSELLNANESKHLTLALDAGDATLASLTDARNPMIVTPGVYAFTLTLHATLGASQGYSTGLLVDDNYYSITGRNSSLGSSDDGTNAAYGCIVWWCDAADPFAVLGQVAAGAGSDTFTGTLYVQRIT